MPAGQNATARYQISIIFIDEVSVSRQKTGIGNQNELLPTNQDKYPTQQYDLLQ